MTPRSTCAVAIGAAFLLTAGAAGCSSSSDTVVDDGAGRPTITLVTHSAFVLPDGIRASVERDLDVRLEVSQTGDGAEALSAAILTAGRPDGDVFFGVDNTLIGRAVASDAFERLDADDVPNLDAVPEALQLDDSGRLVPIDVAPVCVDYDATWFAEQQIAPPDSFEDLIDPTYRNLTVVQSPTTSSTGLVFLAATQVHLGDGADDWWRQLLANGAAVAGGWSDAWEIQYTVSGGDRPIVVSYATSPPAEVVYSDGSVTEPRTRVIEATCAEQIEFAGVLAGTEHPELARQVLNAMLGEEWQASQPLSNFVYPVRPEVELPEIFTMFAARPDTLIPLDPELIATRRDAWIESWRAIAE